MKKAAKKTGNMSDLIREYAEANPTLGPTQIAKELVAKGHKVYPALVSQARKKGANGIVKRGRKPNSESKMGVKGGVGFDVAAMQAASSFVKSVGSIEKAEQALQTYKNLSQLF